MCEQLTRCLNPMLFFPAIVSSMDHASVSASPSPAFTNRRKREKTRGKKLVPKTTAKKTKVRGRRKIPYVLPLQLVELKPM